MTKRARTFGTAFRRGLSLIAGKPAFLVLAAAMVVLPSCGLFGGEPDVVVPGGQTWSGRNWIVQLDGAEWDGCTLSVKLTMTNTGGVVANFGYASSGDTVGYVYVANKYNEAFLPYKRWPWDTQFYEEKFYPNETRSGTVKYEIDPRSEEIRLLMVPYYEDAPMLSFDLGGVPATCE
jgi:hypothetical protein